MQLWIAVLGSSVLAAAVSGVFGLISGRKKKTGGVEAGVQQLLYDRIKYLCKSHIARGKIATNDLEDLERMHKIYHDDLNGNGYLDDLMKTVRTLEVIPILPEKGR